MSVVLHSTICIYVAAVSNSSNNNKNTTDKILKIIQQVDTEIQIDLQIQTDDDLNVLLSLELAPSIDENE